jgi:hypothetical protein
MIELIIQELKKEKERKRNTIKIKTSSGNYLLQFHAGGFGARCPREMALFGVA